MSLWSPWWVTINGTWDELDDVLLFLSWLPMSSLALFPFTSLLFFLSPTFPPSSLPFCVLSFPTSLLILSNLSSLPCQPCLTSACSGSFRWHRFSLCISDDAWVKAFYWIWIASCRTIPLKPQTCPFCGPDRLRWVYERMGKPLQMVGPLPC